MDGHINFALFFIASWALIITPGPDMIYVITRGISQGRKAGLLSALGVTCGILVHTAFAALGLAIILQTSAIAFQIIKYAGAVYLVYLGIKSFRDKTEFDFQSNRQKGRNQVIFTQGLLSNVFNPKVALFFLAFLPQFITTRNENTSLEMAGMGLIFAFCGLLFLSLVGFFSGSIGSWLTRKPAAANPLRWITGSVMVGLGIRLAFMERQ